VSRLSAVAVERLFQSNPNEIFILAPSRVFRYDLSSGVVSVHCNLTYSKKLEIPYAVDINLDGDAEILTANCVYSSIAPCAPLWCASGFLFNLISNGVSSAVANLDADPEGEIIFSGEGMVKVYEHDGTPKWFSTLSSYGGGAPAVADFNGDGVSDIGVGSKFLYSVLNGLDGSVLKTVSLNEPNGYTSSVAFDFQDDGASEMVICAEYSSCYIVSMNWNVSIPLRCPTGSEHVVITDIDLDGTADIVIVGNAVSVVNSNDSWADSEVLWNQHAYNGMNYDPFSFEPVPAKVTNQFRWRPSKPCISPTPSSSIGSSVSSLPSSSTVPVFSSPASPSLLTSTNYASYSVIHTPTPTGSNQPSRVTTVRIKEKETLRYKFSQKSSRQDVNIFVIDKRDNVVVTVKVQRETFRPGYISYICSAFLFYQHLVIIGCVLALNQSLGDIDRSCRGCNFQIISWAIDLSLHGDDDCKESDFRKPVLLAFRSNEVIVV